MAQHKVTIASNDILKGQSADKLMNFTKAEVDLTKNTSSPFVGGPAQEPPQTLLKYGPLSYKLVHNGAELDQDKVYGDSSPPKRHLEHIYRWGPIKFIEPPTSGYSTPTTQDLIANPNSISFFSHRQRCRIESKNIIDYISDNVAIGLDAGMGDVVTGLVGYQQTAEAGPDYPDPFVDAILNESLDEFLKNIASFNIVDTFTADAVEAILSPRDWLDFLFGNNNPDSENYQRFPSGIFEGRLVLPENLESTDVGGTTSIAASDISAIAGTETFIDTVFDITVMRPDRTEMVNSCDYDPFTANNDETSNFIYEPKYNYYVGNYENSIKTVSAVANVTQDETTIPIDEKILPDATIFQLLKDKYGSSNAIDKTDYLFQHASWYNNIPGDPFLWTSGKYTIVEEDTQNDEFISNPNAALGFGEMGKYVKQWGHLAEDLSNVAMLDVFKTHMYNVGIYSNEFNGNGIYKRTITDQFLSTDSHLEQTAEATMFPMSIRFKFTPPLPPNYVQPSSVFSDVVGDLSTNPTPDDHPGAAYSESNFENNDPSVGAVEEQSEGIEGVSEQSSNNPYVMPPVVNPAIITQVHLSTGEKDMAGKLP